MKKLLIATHNPAKLAEFKRTLKDISVKTVSLNGLKVKRKIKEIGENYKVNAILKAKNYARISGLPALSDDGGLEIKALGGWPGIKSRRITGKMSTDQELIDCTLEKMRDLSMRKRGASLKGVLCLAFPNGKHYLSEAEIKGFIMRQPAKKIQKGFPFRSILWIPRFKKYFINLSQNEWDLISHRKKAIKKFIPILKKYARH